MRTLSTFEQLVATRDEHGLQLHQFATGELSASLGGDRVRLRMETELPWTGSVRVTIDETPGQPWTLTMRMPAWLRAGRMHVAGEERPVQSGTGVMAVERAWARGDVLSLELDMPARFTTPDERIDAVRGCVAIERGPLVYCLEQTDLPGANLDDVEVDPRQTPAPRRAGVPAFPASTVGIDVAGFVRSRPDADDPPWPYRDRSVTTSSARTPVRLAAYPYLVWANREAGPMRVWLPVSGEE